MSRITGKGAIRTVRTKWKSANVLDVVVMDSIDNEMTTYTLHYDSLVVEVEGKPANKVGALRVLDMLFSQIKEGLEAGIITKEDCGEIILAIGVVITGIEKEFNLNVEDKEVEDHDTDSCEE